MRFSVLLKHLLNVATAAPRMRAVDAHMLEEFAAMARLQSRFDAFLVQVTVRIVSKINGVVNDSTIVLHVGLALLSAASNMLLSKLVF